RRRRWPSGWPGSSSCCSSTSRSPASTPPARRPCSSCWTRPTRAAPPSSSPPTTRCTSSGSTGAWRCATARSSTTGRPPSRTCSSWWGRRRPAAVPAPTRPGPDAPAATGCRKSDGALETGAGADRRGDEGERMLVEGKTIGVSGVGAGLGREVAAAALRDGANVVLGARTAANLDKIAGELDPGGKRLAWRATDITDRDQCAALAATAIERFGRIDGLVNCAALDSIFGGLEDADWDEWRRAVDVNLLGTMQM